MTPEQRANLLKSEASEMTMEDIDEAVENKEITLAEAENARFSLRARRHQRRFVQAIKKVDGSLSK